VKTKKLRQYFNWVTAAVVILLTVGCGDEIPPGTAPEKSSKTVKTAISAAEIVSQPQFYEAAGTVFAKNSAVVSAKVMGEIRRVTVREGDVVKAGDLLVEIDDARLSAQLKQAEAALAEARQSVVSANAAFESARAALVLAEKTLKRYEMLLEADSVSQQEFDEVKARYDQAAGAFDQAKSMRDGSKNRVEQAKAGVRAAKSTFNDTVVTAPYDATVTGKLVEKGDLASPGIPLIRLETAGLTEVHLVVPESYIRQVRIGDALSVLIASLQKESFSATVETINPAADPAVRSFQMKLSLPDHPDIRAGMFARVRVPVGKSDMMLVPETAVIRHGQLSGVYIVDKEGIAHFQLIRPGRSYDGQLEVLAGLSPGDRYITHPDPNIIDGIKVEAS